MRYNAIDKGFLSCDKWQLEGKVFAEDSRNENKYGTELTEVSVESSLIVIGGHYADATIDFDISVSPICSGYNYELSDYESVEEMVADILGDMDDNAEYYTDYDEKWNYGIWKMNRKHVKKWLCDLINAEIERLNEFCENNCDCKLERVAVFSNGEAFYRKVV